MVLWIVFAYSLLCQTVVPVGPLDPGISKAKEVTFVFRTDDGPFPIDRLLGEKLTLEGTTGKFVSTPIAVERDEGTCKLTAVPPGGYKLSFPVFKLKTQITVRDVADRSVKFLVTIGRAGVTIVESTEKLRR